MLVRPGMMRARGGSSGGGGGYTFTNAEASSLVARMGTTPDDTRKALIDTLIGSGKTNLWWVELDALYVFAAHAQADALLNWKAAANNCTITGSPTFTIDRGFTGTGSASDKLDTNFNPATHGVKFTQNANGVYLYNRVDGQSNALTYTQGGANQAAIRDTSNRYNTRIQAGGSVLFTTVANAIGFYCALRSGAADTSIAVRKDKAALTRSGSSASVALVSANFELLASSTRQLSVFAVGSNMTTAKNDFFNDDIVTFLTALGAI